MAAPSITEFILGNKEPEAPLWKANGGFVGYADEGGSVPVPRSWFGDPHAMLDQMGLGYRTSPSGLTYETLRAMAEKNVVISAIHQTRINQVASFCIPQANKYSIGYKVRHRDPDRKLTDGERRYIRKLEEIVLRMGIDRNPDRDSFEDWTKKIVRDRLTFDQLNSEKVLRRNGKVHSLYAVDAGTIRIAQPHTNKSTPLTPREVDRVERYVQVVDGRIVNRYTRKEMVFRVANPRTDLRVSGYGYSELEMLINTVTAHLWAEEWNRKAFSQGSTTKGIINIGGNIPANQMDAFRRQWMTQVASVTNAWKTPILNADNLQWIPLQPSNNEMGYQQWLDYLIKVAAAVYLIDPAEINFDTRGGTGAQPMFMSTNEAQQKVSKDRGLQPLLRFVQKVVNEDFLNEIDPDYVFQFMGLDAKTEAEAIELRQKELGSYKTLNETREQDGLPPVEDGDIVLNPTFTGYKNQLFMQKQSAAQSQMGGMGGMPGGEEGGEEGPEAFEGLFGDPEKPPKFGSAERALGATVDRKANALARKQNESDDSEEYHTAELTDPWEDTIRASATARLRTVERALSDDLRKAMAPFGDLE